MATLAAITTRSIARLQAARVAVPSGFNGQFERFQFLLPGNQIGAL